MLAMCRQMLGNEAALVASALGDVAWVAKGIEVDWERSAARLAYLIFLNPSSIAAEIQANTSSNVPMPSILMTPCCCLYFAITGTVLVSCSCKRLTIFEVLVSYGMQPAVLLRSSSRRMSSRVGTSISIILEIDEPNFFSKPSRM